MATTTQNLGKVGLVDKGIYSSTTTYNRLDFVTDANNISTYISLVDSNKGNDLTDSSYWRYLAKGKANTPEEVLDLLLQADGDGSGLDADKLDGTELAEIVNPEEVTSSSPFDFFLGAKEVTQDDGTTKWVFQKMSPSTMATVAAGLIGINHTWLRERGRTVLDLNNAIDPGIYHYYVELGALTNGPEMDRFVLAVFQSSGFIAQIAISVVSSTSESGYSKIAFRGFVGTGWTPWFVK